MLASLSQFVPRSADAWLQLLTGLSTVLLSAAWACGRRAYRAYPAMGAYLLVNALTSALIFAMVSVPQLSAGHAAKVISCIGWLASYAVSGVLIFFIARQIFQDALAPLPGLRRLALVIFEWVAVVSVLISVPTALMPLFTRSQPFQLTILQSLRGISVMEFCLIVFVLLAANALHIGWRSLTIGIALGFGILALVDTVCFIAILRSSSSHLMAWILVRRSGSTLAAAMWLAWLLLPVPVRAAAGQRHAQLQRWNEIAVALGKPAPNIALSQPEPRGLFLQDVEAVVDRVLRRNDVQPPGVG